MRRIPFPPFAALALMTALVALAGCDDGSGSAACSIDGDCGQRGLVCNNEQACVELPCQTRQDCGQNRTCFEGSCTARECTSDGDCASGLSCVGLLCLDPGTASCTTDTDCAAFNRVCNPITGQCVEPSGCTTDTDCPSGQSCNPLTGQCIAGCIQDGDCPADKYCAAGGSCETGCRQGTCAAGELCDLTTRTCIEACTVSQCAALGQTCDTTTGQCVDRTGKGLCESCTSGSDECGGPGDRCHPLGGSFVCTFACETDDDCSAGFRCAALTTAAKGCIPQGGTCTGCLLSGCTAGEVCNPDSTMCQPGIDSCRLCTADFECGDGSVCTDFGGRDRCLPRCGAGGTCDSGYTCDTATNLCLPDSGSCTSCTLDPSSCAAGLVLDEDKCACVECISNSDCSSGEACALGTGQCLPGSGQCASSNECSGACVGAQDGLPGVCVECASAADCNPGAACTNYECVDCNCPIGQQCQPDGSCLDPDRCNQDSDCVSRRGDGYRCDNATKLCYLPGECNPGDPTLAPCPSGVCGGGILPLPMCTCQLLGGAGCRAGEQCIPFDFTTGTGSCFGG